MNRRTARSYGPGTRGTPTGQTTAESQNIELTKVETGSQTPWRQLLVLSITVNLDDIRRLVIIAMFTDDVLFEQLVLKGGNAISLVYGYGSRSSLDVDFSIEHEFADVAAASGRIKNALEDRFGASGYSVFDYKFGPRPREISTEIPKGWGGYRAEFKIIEREKFDAASGNLDIMRRNASVVGPAQLRTFLIDISKCEYCAPKTERELERYSVFVYTPAMLAIEKLRAICQQMPEYPLRERKTARARDFYDIWLIVSSTGIDLTALDNAELAINIFAAKEVDLNLLEKLGTVREFHRPDWPAVQDSVAGDLEDFDFYFEFVVMEAQKLIYRLARRAATQN